MAVPSFYDPNQHDGNLDRLVAFGCVQALLQWCAMGVAELLFPTGGTRDTALDWADTPIDEMVTIAQKWQGKQADAAVYEVGWLDLRFRRRRVRPLLGLLHEEEFPDFGAFILDFDDDRLPFVYRYAELSPELLCLSDVVDTVHVGNIRGFGMPGAHMTARQRQYRDDLEQHYAQLRTQPEFYGAIATVLPLEELLEDRHRLPLRLAIRTAHGTTFTLSIPLLNISERRDLKVRQLIELRSVARLPQFARHVPDCARMLWGLAHARSSRDVWEQCVARWSLADEADAGQWHIHAPTSDLATLEEPVVTVGGLRIGSSRPPLLLVFSILDEYVADQQRTTPPSLYFASGFERKYGRGLTFRRGQASNSDVVRVRIGIKYLEQEPPLVWEYVLTFLRMLRQGKGERALLLCVLTRREEDGVPPVRLRIGFRVRVVDRPN